MPHPQPFLKIRNLPRIATVIPVKTGIQNPKKSCKILLIHV